MANTKSAASMGSAVTPKLAALFKDYAAHHRTKGNQICHWIGLPIITISTLGLFSMLVIAGGGEGNAFLRLDGGVILWALAIGWYLTLDWKITIPWAMAGAGFYFFGRAMPLWMLLTLFIGGWIIQFIGHSKYEKARPAFMDNLRHLLIGPLWLFAKVVGYSK